MKRSLSLLFTLFLLIPAGTTGDGILAEEPSLLLGEDGSEDHALFYKPADILISPEDELYVLDSGNGRIQVFGLDGTFHRSIGTFGQGPGELYEPSTFTFVGNALWVVDYRNARIQVFENGEYVTAHRPLRPTVPAKIAVVGDTIFIGDHSLHDKKGGLVMLNRQGRDIGDVTFGLSPYKGAGDILWNIAELIPLPTGELMVGFRFFNRLAFVSEEGKVLRQVDMEKFYDRYERKEPQGTIAPDGFAATTFSAGPEETILAITCNNEVKSCSVLCQFNDKLTEQIAREPLKFHAWKMIYSRKHEGIGFIDGEGRVRFHALR